MDTLPSFRAKNVRPLIYRARPYCWRLFCPIKVDAQMPRWRITEHATWAGAINGVRNFYVQR